MIELRDGIKQSKSDHKTSPFHSWMYLLFFYNPSPFHTLIKTSFFTHVEASPVACGDSPGSIRLCLSHWKKLYFSSASVNSIAPCSTCIRDRFRCCTGIGQVGRDSLYGPTVFGTCAPRMYTDLDRKGHWLRAERVLFTFYCYLILDPRQKVGLREVFEIFQLVRIMKVHTIHAAVY